ncbi:MAG: hypothetical protein DRI90_19070 [Deltaproteobacteria bacterium]|nr:MAG: hypothetical protein DRI90_19070 [Deltaproteobacteria bacterium]
MAEVELEVAVFSSDPFQYQQIGAEACRMRKLGMSLRVIGRALGVNEKTVRKALASVGAC